MTILLFSPALLRDSEENFKCRCDRVAKFVDPVGYDMVDCQVVANAIRLHDEVVIILANLFRSILIDHVVEPLQLFDADADDRRIPNILIRNPRCFDRQVNFDVTVVLTCSPEQAIMIRTYPLMIDTSGSLMNTMTR